MYQRGICSRLPVRGIGSCVVMQRMFGAVMCLCRAADGSSFIRFYCLRSNSVSVWFSPSSQLTTRQHPTVFKATPAVCLCKIHPQNQNHWISMCVCDTKPGKIWRQDYSEHCVSRSPLSPGFRRTVCEWKSFGWCICDLLKKRLTCTNLKTVMGL